MQKQECLITFHLRSKIVLYPRAFSLPAPPDTETVAAQRESVVENRTTSSVAWRKLHITGLQLKVANNNSGLVDANGALCCIHLIDRQLQCKTGLQCVNTNPFVIHWIWTHSGPRLEPEILYTHRHMKKRHLVTRSYERLRRLAQAGLALAGVRPLTLWRIPVEISASWAPLWRTEAIHHSHLITNPPQNFNLDHSGQCLGWIQLQRPLACEGKSVIWGRRAKSGAHPTQPATTPPTLKWPQIN